MFTEEYGTNINNGDRKEFQIRKKSYHFLSLVTFKELQEKSTFLKIVNQAFEFGDFLNIFLMFLGSWGSFSYKNFSKTWLGISLSSVRFRCYYYIIQSWISRRMKTEFPEPLSNVAGLYKPITALLRTTKRLSKTY